MHIIYIFMFLYGYVCVYVRTRMYSFVCVYILQKLGQKNTEVGFIQPTFLEIFWVKYGLYQISKLKFKVPGISFELKVERLKSARYVVGFYYIKLK